MKKLPVYVKYPLVLGCVCLVCGGALAGVNAATEGKISQNAYDKAHAAMYKLIDTNNLKTTGDPSVIEWDEGVEHTYLDERNLIPTDSGNYYYYNATSPKGFSGTITFGALVDPSYSVIGFKFITGDEDTIGKSAAGAIDISASKPFTDSDGVVESGASAGKTLPAITTALKAVIADARTIK